MIIHQINNCPFAAHHTFTSNQSVCLPSPSYDSPAFLFMDCLFVEPAPLKHCELWITWFLISSPADCGFPGTLTLSSADPCSGLLPWLILRLSLLVLWDCTCVFAGAILVSFYEGSHFVSTLAFRFKLLFTGFKTLGTAYSCYKYNVYTFQEICVLDCISGSSCL